MSSSDGFNDNPEEGLHPQIREVLRAFENRVRSLENENKEARRQIASLNREIQVLRQSESNNENNNINIAQPTNSSSRPGVKQRGLVIQPAQSTDSPRAAAAGAGANERALIYEPDEHKAGLSEDTFSLMKINPILSMSWLYSTIVYIIQFTLLLMIFAEQISSSSNSTPFDVPFVVGPTVRVGQLLAIVITVVLAQDVLMPIKELSMLWITNPKQWMKVTGYDGGCMTWVMRILLPNILQLIIGTLAVMVSFVIIIQSEDVIELLADFAAMSVIAELDNVAFWFAGQGYAGDVIMKDTVKIREVEVDSLERRKLIGINLRPFLFIALLMVMIGGFTPIIIGQTNGDFFHLKYPNCAIKSTEQIDMIGNGVCDGGYINRYECGFDGGDCQNFNSQYPTCDAANPEEVGDGECHQTYNTEDCGYDGGDCCSMKEELVFGDGFCHAGLLNTAKCLYDSGDCDKLRQKYPNCQDYEEDITDEEGHPIVIGNGICDSGKKNIKAYMNEECGWVFGDCNDMKQKDIEMRAKYPHCSGVTEFFRIGDGVCDKGPYLTEECGFDGLDCCELDHSKIGDGVCDSGNDEKLYLRSECGYEGYDCCEYLEKAGNDFCGDEIYELSGLYKPKEEVTFNAKCGWDRGDCEVAGYPDCRVDVPSRIGDGICNGGGYNKEVCGFDGGDCIEFNTLYPNCSTNRPYKVGDGLCEQSNGLNTKDCGFDGGDCVIFNAKYPDCNTNQAYRVGDGYCNTQLNNQACGYDGGDCNGESTAEFSINYPYCDAEDPKSVGDGTCQNRYNTAECGWDGGDCFSINLFLNANFPDCVVSFPGSLGDGVCQGGEYNTEECGYDLGDCTEFNDLYPNCDVLFPNQVGDGNCFFEYNTEECGYDGGDCLNRL